MIPRPYDHLQIKHIMQDFKEYSHILFLSEEVTGAFLKLLPHYHLTLENKKLLSLTPNKHLSNYVECDDAKIRSLFLSTDEKDYILIPRLSDEFPRVADHFIQKGIRLQSPAILDR